MLFALAASFFIAPSPFGNLQSLRCNARRHTDYSIRRSSLTVANLALVALTTCSHSASGENQEPVTKDPNKYPVDWWQEVASPVWMTVDQGRVLNKDGARDNNDERHICPLQLDVIERAVELWSNPGDLVYSPFTGIGSEGVGALTLNRRFIGSELKESYFNQARQNLANAKAQLTLF